MNIDNIYWMLVENIKASGYEYEMLNRKETSVKQIDTYSFTYDMANGFPLISLKHVSFHNIASELNWFLSGSTDIGYLQRKGVKIWDKDVYNYGLGTTNHNGYAGKVYGYQWRNFGAGRDGLGGFDQIEYIVDKLRKGGVSRRGVVTAWNPREVAQKEMCLPPCHWAFEVIENTRNNSFSLKWHQRSCDVFLGIPYNIASYALLGKYLEWRSGKKFTHLHADLSCVHIYAQHFDAVDKMLTNSSKHDANKKVDVVLKSINSLYDFDWDIINYEHCGKIAAPMIAEHSKLKE